MIKRIIYTLIVAATLLCAVFGASYFVGWLTIEPDEIKPESTVSLTEVRAIGGFVLLSLCLSVITFFDLVEKIWKLTKK